MIGYQERQSKHQEKKGKTRYLPRKQARFRSYFFSFINSHHSHKIYPFDILFLSRPENFKSVRWISGGYPPDIHRISEWWWGCRKGRRDFRALFAIIQLRSIKTYVMVFVKNDSSIEWYTLNRSFWRFCLGIEWSKLNLNRWYDIILCINWYKSINMYTNYLNCVFWSKRTSKPNSAPLYIILYK